MRLLFDEQLSNRMPRLLADSYPDSLHIEALDRGGAPDIILWQAAVVHGFVLVTKDEDLLRRHIEDLRQFAAQDEVGIPRTGRTTDGLTCGNGESKATT